MTQQDMESVFTNRIESKTNFVASTLDEVWSTKLYSDVDIYCSGGQIVKAHKLLLASSSSNLQMILRNDDDSLCTTLIMPDVDSKVLESFFDKVCHGCKDEVAHVPEMLEYLRFTGSPVQCTKSLVVVHEEVEEEKHEHFLFNNIKSEPELILDDEPDFDFDDDEEDVEEDEDEEEMMLKPPKKKKKMEKKKQKIWQHFEQLDKKYSECKSCGLVVKTDKGTITGMTSHLRSAHPDLSVTIKSTSSSISTVGKKKTKRSHVWKFFTESSDNKESAVCNSCHGDIKTENSNTTGMINHLRCIHPELHRELKKLMSSGISAVCVEKDPSVTKETKSSPVWQFYDPIDSSHAKCSECGTMLRTFAGSTSGLLRHLRRVHPEAYTTCMKSNNKNEDFESSEEFKNMLQELNDQEDQDNLMWKFFTAKDGKECATCNECHVEVYTVHDKQVASLEEHLRASHTDLLEQYESECKAKVTLELSKGRSLSMKKRKYGSRVVTSAIWSFFKKTASESTNQCLTCLVEIDCSSKNATAMIKHLEAEHADKHALFIKQSGIGAKGLKKSSSAIWAYFDKTTPGQPNLCKACGKEINSQQSNTTNMIRHLEHNHKELFQEFSCLKAIKVDDDKMEEELLVLQQKKKRGPKPKIGSSNPKDDDPVSRTCPDCGKEYSCRPAMLFHFKCVHSGVRPYKCEECGMTFARVDSWKSHTHSKVRSFLCSMCGKTFARRNIRDTHERAHLNDRRYPCSFCGKKFMTNQQRTNHERTHTGEKPFQCTDCGRQFAQQHQLTTHTRIHTGEKPYSCKHCGQKFRHLSSRNNHKCEGKVAAARWTTENEAAQRQADIIQEIIVPQPIP